MIYLKKYCRGVRKYIADGQNAYDIIVIKWNEENQWYDINGIDEAFENNDDFQSEIFRQWAYTIPVAKRRVMMCSGMKAKDFVWEEH